MAARSDPYKKAVAARTTKMERVVFTIDADLITRFDKWAADAGFTSRAEALRSIVGGNLQRATKNEGARP